jgi:hypothetical protein
MIGWMFLGGLSGGSYRMGEGTAKESDRRHKSKMEDGGRKSV